MDNEHPYFEARNERKESDIRYFKIAEDSWVRKATDHHIIHRETIVQLKNEFIRVTNRHVISFDPSEDHCGTFRFLERHEAARWYLLNGFEFPEGLARLVDGRINDLETPKAAADDETLAVEERYKPQPCTECGGKSRVYNTKPLESGKKRRYIECLNDECGHKWKAVG